MTLKAFFSDWSGQFGLLLVSLQSLSLGMKVFSLILGLFVLLMTVTPCCSGEESCTESELASESSDGSAEDLGHELPCSPFFSCGSCIGFVQKEGIGFLFDFSLELISKEYQTFYLASAKGFFELLLKPPAI
jgi:hypothetical protein